MSPWFQRRIFYFTEAFLHMSGLVPLAITFISFPAFLRGLSNFVQQHLTEEHIGDFFHILPKDEQNSAILFSVKAELTTFIIPLTIALAAWIIVINLILFFVSVMLDRLHWNSAKYVRRMVFCFGIVENT